MLKYRGILTCEQDLAGKWRVLVDCTDENISLKFQTEPDDSTVRAVCEPICTRMNNERSVELLASIPPSPQYAKLDIRRAMRAQGTEAALDALLDASPVFRADWTDARAIDLADPVLVAALAQVGIDPAPIIAAIQPL
jgi:hypothetical protein